MVFKKGCIPWNKGIHWSEEVKLKMSVNHANFCGKNNPRYGKKHSEDTKERWSKIRRGRTPVNKGKHLSEETKKKIRLSRIKTISEHPEILKKMLNISKPNYRELQLLSILNNLYPNQWRYVGDGSVIINGKNPDFINCNGKKLIIELFGEHWHKCGSEEERKNVFREYGYNTLIIWIKELSNNDYLNTKIKEFVGV